MLLCNHCTGERKSKNSLIQHEIKCPSNPERKYSSGMLGKKGGNQFTTGRVKGHTEETKQLMKIVSSNKRHTEASKKKISIARIKYLKEHPEKVPYRINHSSKISYPELYFSECFADVVNLEKEHQVGLYSLDFANVADKLYLEIDGEQHYLDDRIVESDKKRTAKLTELGWIGYRIRWSDFQRLTEDEKKRTILNIRSMMKWYHS